MERHRTNQVFVLTCFSLLAVTGMATMLDTGRIPGPLAQAPSWHLLWARPGAFTAGVDAYLGDRFGLRAQWLGLNALLRRSLASSASSDVVIGKRGWMYYARGLVDRTPPVIARRKRLAEQYGAVLISMAHKVAAGGGRMLVMIPPDKHSIYPEHLPTWLRRRAAAAEGVREHLAAALDEAGVSRVDVHGALEGAAKRKQVYFRTDTHWNALGAEIAFGLVADSVGWPSSPAAPDVRRERVLQRVGDLARMAFLGHASAEFDLEAALPKQPVSIESLDVPNDPRSEAYRASRSGVGPSILVIGDSFTRGMWDHVALRHAGELIWLPHRSCGVDWPTVESFGADVVVYAVVERNIGCLPARARRLLAQMAGSQP